MIADSELLRRFSEEGSQEAFAELVRRHVDLVYSAAIQHTRSRHRAEDVAQSVFVAMARKAKSLSGRSDIVGWLYTSARYASMSLVRAEARREARERRSAEEEGILSGETAAPPVTPGNQDESLRRFLEEALADLKDHDRSALLLRYWENLSWEEIGANLSTTADGARKRVERTIERLHDRLTRKGIASSGAAIAAALAESLVAAPSRITPAILEAASVGGAGAAVTGGVSGFLATSKVALVAALGVVALGVGAAIKETLDARRSAHAAEAAERREIAAALALSKAKARIRIAQARAATIRNAVLKARPASVSAGTQVRDATTQYLRGNPDVVSMAKELRERYFAHAYARFIAEQHLSLDQAKALVATLTDYGALSAGGYLLAPSGGEGLPPRSEAVRRLLGADGSKALDAYEEDLRDESVIAHPLELMLAADPTVGSKAGELASVLRTSWTESLARQRDAAGQLNGPFDDADYLWKTIQKASAFLTPSQIDKLRLAAEATTGSEEPKS